MLIGILVTDTQKIFLICFVYDHIKFYEGKYESMEEALAGKEITDQIWGMDMGQKDAGYLIEREDNRIFWHINTFVHKIKIIRVTIAVYCNHIAISFFILRINNSLQIPPVNYGSNMGNGYGAEGCRIFD